jgi:hypothetical protein
MNNKEIKQTVEKHMSRLKVYEAIIDSKNISKDMIEDPEKLAVIEKELKYYNRLKQQLNLIYSSLKPVQREIWERRYLREDRDIDIINDMHIEYGVHKDKYYRLKKEMINDVIKALSLDI